jgi:hypothetical protein
MSLISQILIGICTFIVIVAIAIIMGRRAKKVKEVDGEPVILASYVTYKGWEGYLFLTRSKLAYKKVLSGKYLLIPIEEIKNYEAKRDSLFITTEDKQYKFRGLSNINEWISKLNELSLKK